MVDNIRRDMPRIGTRKLYHILGDELPRLGVGRDKFFRILRANHRLIAPKRSYKVTTNSHHRFRKHKDIVADLTINRPEQVWVSDITYIGGRDRHCYLALVTDSYSKKIVGFDLSDSLSTDSSLRALKMAARGRMYKEPLIHHSDRGLQYC
ncbi:MAG: DDE-type integrase/transposase/recombinase, partial [Rikenellaceae bacterium]